MLALYIWSLKALIKVTKVPIDNMLSSVLHVMTFKAECLHVFHSRM